MVQVGEPRRPPSRPLPSFSAEEPTEFYFPASRRGNQEGAECQDVDPSSSAAPALDSKDWAPTDLLGVFACTCVFVSWGTPTAHLVAVTIWKGQACHTLLPAVQQVGSSFVIVSEGHGVIVEPRQAVWVSLKTGPLFVGEGHGKQSLGVTHKLVHVPLTSHLSNETKHTEIK